MKETRNVADGQDFGMEGLKDLYERARPLPELTEAESRRLRRRVRQTVLSDHRPFRRFRLGTVVGAVALLLLGGMGFAVADRLGWVPLPWKAAFAPAGSTKAPALPTHRKARMATPAPESVPPVVATPEPVPAANPAPEPLPSTVPTPAPAVEAREVPAPVPSGRRRAKLDTPVFAPSARAGVPAEPAPSMPVAPVQAQAPQEAAPPPPESPLPAVVPPDSEAGLLRTAIRKLRQEGDPAAALAMLSDVAKRFPAGPLVGERATLEVEALLALGREGEALSRLDGMSLSDLPRSGERFVLRGELRTRVRRFAEAAADFDRALSRVSGSPAWHERALWGRAVARLYNQQRQQGIADLEDYLEQYPKGGHAAEARSLLRSR